MFLLLGTHLWTVQAVAKHCFVRSPCRRSFLQSEICDKRRRASSPLPAYHPNPLYSRFRRNLLVWSMKGNCLSNHDAGHQIN